MENDIGLDDLILKDRQDRKKNRQERTKVNRTKRIEKNHRRNDHGDRQRGRNHHNREGNQHRSKFEDRLQDRFQDRTSTRDFQENRGYTLLIKGFVADVSTDDIFKLLKGKKIYKISTFLQNEARSIIEYKKEMPLDVKIKFQNKEDADDFMQQYSNKLLDGKHSLTFSFVR